MFKKQKSKILVFLLLLGLLYGCKRQILDPLNPQTNLPQKAQFDKVKAFYEKGRYKNQPKRSSNGNERMTAADSARFKDFEPQWDKTQVELLPNNQKMLIVPVVRFLRVEYNQEISFIRRLCIRVDENEDFLEANIVELVGNLTFVKENHNAIFKNYKENSPIGGFSGLVAVYELDYDLQITKFYDIGNFIKSTLPTNIFKAMVNSGPNCGLYVTTIGNSTIVHSTCSGTVTVFGSGDGGGGGNGLPDFIEGDGSSGPYSPPIVTMPPCKDCPPPTVVVIPPVTTTTNPSPIVIPPMPHPGMIYDTEFGWIDPMPHPGMVYDAEFGWIDPPPPVDNGCSFCGNDWGDGIPRDQYGNPIVPMTPDDKLKLVKYRKIINLSTGISLAKELKFAKILDSLRNASPIVDSVYRKIEKNLISRAIMTPNGAIAPRMTILHIVAVQGPEWAENFGITKVEANGIPTIKLGEKAGPEVFFEELTHALQYLERNSNVAATNDELVHMEFEAKVINHMVFGFRGGTELFAGKNDKPQPQWIQDYLRWLPKIRLENRGTFNTNQFNNINWNIQIRNFAAHPDAGYNYLLNANFPPIRLPTVLFLLFNP